MTVTIKSSEQTKLQGAIKFLDAKEKNQQKFTKLVAALGEYVISKNQEPHEGH